MANLWDNPNISPMGGASLGAMQAISRLDPNQVVPGVGGGMVVPISPFAAALQALSGGLTGYKQTSDAQAARDADAAAYAELPGLIAQSQTPEGKTDWTKILGNKNQSIRDFAREMYQGELQGQARSGPVHSIGTDVLRDAEGNLGIYHAMSDGSFKRAEGVTPFQQPKVYQVNQGNKKQIVSVDPLSGQESVVSEYDVGMTPGQEAQFSPQTQATIAQEREAGKIKGKAQGQAQVDLPSVEFDTAQVNDLTGKLTSHPGFEAMLGKVNMLGSLSPKDLPTTEAQDAFTIHKQLSGKAYMAARQMLRGGGQITEQEANRAEQAFARFNTAQTPQQYKDALNEFVSQVNAGSEKLRQAAQGNFAVPKQPTNVKTSINMQALPEKVVNSLKAKGWSYRDGKVYNERGQLMRPNL